MLFLLAVNVNVQYTLKRKNGYPGLSPRARGGYIRRPRVTLSLFAPQRTRNYRVYIDSKQCEYDETFLSLFKSINV